MEPNPEPARALFRKLNRGYAVMLVAIFLNSWLALADVAVSWIGALLAGITVGLALWNRAVYAECRRQLRERDRG